MTESQRIVLEWKARLQAAGWPEDRLKRCISELCEAGYRQCIDDINAKHAQKEAILTSAAAAFKGNVN